MKKIITFLSALVLVASAQAATINWGCGTWNSASANNDDPEWDGWSHEGTRFWLFYFGLTKPADTPVVTTFDPETGVTNLGGALVSSEVLDYDQAYNGAFSVAYHTLTHTPVDGDDMTGHGNGWYLVTMYDPETPGFYAHSNFLEIADLGPLDPAANLGPQLGTTEGAIGSNMIPIPIPEPSTLALLAFGVAAIGLRRKVTK